MCFLCFSKKVMRDMKGWVVSDAGDRWTVQLDVRDLGGHLDSTSSSRATTLGYRIAAAVPQVPSVPVLPLDFCGKLHILRTMHLPAALHGAEVSLVSISGLRGLRSAFGRAAMSGGLRMANPGLLVQTWVSCCLVSLSDVRKHMAYNSAVHELAGVLSLLPVLLGMVRFTSCCPVLRLLGSLGIPICVFG